MCVYPGHTHTLNIYVPGAHTHTLYICTPPGGAEQLTSRPVCVVPFVCFGPPGAPRGVGGRRAGQQNPARWPGGQQDGQLQFTTCSAGTNVGADGHTASNAPDLFRPPKLSGAGPGQYWGGGPPGKTLGCCQLLVASKTQQDGQAASKTASCNLPPVLPEHTHTLYIYLHPGHTEIY